MLRDIVIIGAGGFGREVAWLIEDINKVKKEWNLLGFVDDNKELHGKSINGYEILGGIDWLKGQETFVVNAVGDPITKKNALRKLKGSDNKYPVLIHPSAILSDKVAIGEGTIICAGSIITVNVNIGKHVIINIDSTIGHDAIINDYSTILPSVNISGNVIVEECVSVGTGAAIIPSIRIGENTIIGAGSVVIRDIPDSCTAVGNPAKIIKINN